MINLAFKSLLIWGIIIGIIFPGFILGQLANRWWFFGDKAGLDFYYSNPILSSGYCSGVGSSVFSDNLGNLHLYSDGKKVWNAQHQILISDIQGDTNATQAALFVPDPYDSNAVYLFTTQVLGGKLSVSHFIYKPYFQVIYKNKPLLSAATEKIHGIQVQGKKSYLVFAHEWNSDRYVHWKIDSTGFYGPFFQNIGTYHGTPGGYNAKGWLKVAQTGNFLASAIEWNGKIEMFDLDIHTGYLSNPKSLNIRNPYGLAFSPSGNYLYFSNQFFGTGGVRVNQVWQMETANMQNTLVGSWTGDAFSPDYVIGAIQNGLDGRLYIAKDAHNYLATIQFPEKRGTACQFQVTGQNLYGRFSRRGLPNILAQDLIPPLADFSFTDHICMGNMTQLQAINPSISASYTWTISGPSGFLQSSQPHWSPILDSAGIHQVQLSVQSNIGAQTIQKQLVVLPNPIRPFALHDTLCIGDTLVLSAKNPGATYYWSNGYTNNQITVTQTQKIQLRVYYQAGTCDSIFETEIVFIPKPIFAIPDTHICRQTFVELVSPVIGNYLWSDQSTQNHLLITHSGQYWLEVNQGSCSYRDSFNVTISSDIDASKNNSVYFCPLETPFYTLKTSQALRYLWNTGDSSEYITVSDTGIYFVSRLTTDSCTWVDTFYVRYNCSSPYFPNAFTPNGLNPIFKAISTDWIQGTLQIYNAWGQCIFQGESWDGGNAPEGNYTFVWQGFNRYGEKQTRAGSVLLIR